MSDLQRDPELRARFAELKRVDASKAPAFADVMAGVQEEAAAISQKPKVLTIRRVRWASVLAAAAAIAALIVLPRTNSNEAAFEQAVQAFSSNPALGGWRSPTDGLLNVPGSQLISTIPTVQQ
jgi:anti-sigma factor RsiW